jgi:DNA invertase Pin-like site-specific DNA recombinase
MDDIKSESLSIVNQHNLLDRFIETMDKEDAEVLEFVDNGYSGTNFERPAMQELLTLVQQNRINCIIVKDFSRFGRNSIEAGYLLEMVFPVFHIRFISVSDNFDTADHLGDTGGMEMEFKLLIHELYSRDISNKIKSSVYQRMRRGEYKKSSYPYGYKKGADGTIELDPTAAEVVKFIFHSALSMGISDITKALYHKKILTPKSYFFDLVHNDREHSGKDTASYLWGTNTIYNILHNEEYTGTYVLNRYTVPELGSKRKINKQESDWIRIPHHHPAIIEQELFDKVNGLIKNVKITVKRHPKEYVLMGKIYCGCCHHKLRKNNDVMMCRNTYYEENADCFHFRISIKKIEEQIFALITKNAGIILKQQTNGGKQNANEEQKLVLANECVNDQQVKSYQNQKRLLYEKMILQEITIQEYRAQKEALDGKQNRIEILSSKGKNTYDTSENTLKSAQIVVKQSVLTKELMDLLIEKVWVYPDHRIEIEWKDSGFALEMH